MTTTINISGNLTPIDPNSLYHTICYYSPIPLAPLLAFNIPYALFLYLDIAPRIFGDWSGDSLKDQVLSSFLDPKKAVSKILIVNISYLVALLLLPA